jgi:hypothetical protein
MHTYIVTDHAGDTFTLTAPTCIDVLTQLEMRDGIDLDEAQYTSANIRAGLRRKVLYTVERDGYLPFAVVCNYY